MLRNIVNEGDSDAAMPAPQETFRTPAPKVRTHTTPGKLLSARSENDMRKIGNTPTPRSRTATTGTSLSAARANLRPTPRSTSNTPKPVRTTVGGLIHNAVIKFKFFTALIFPIDLFPAFIFV